MLRTTAIGLVSAIALGVSLASPAGAMSGKTGGGGSAAITGGGAVHSVNAGPGSITAVRSYSSPGRIADHDIGRMRMGRDHDRDHDRGRDGDHDRDRHDHDRLRFFPAFAFGVNTYADTYDPTYGDCWELHGVWRHGGWRLHRFWVCN
jgi:hypothetical protein